MNSKGKLKEIIKSKGIILEETVLASGKKSPYYYDVKQAIMTPEALTIAGELGLELAHDLQGRSVGGLESGAIPFATAISLASSGKGNPLQLFFVRKQSKMHGRGKWIEGLVASPAVIVDDVVTTGSSSAVAIDRLNEAGYKVAGVIALVDREEGALDNFNSRGIKFISIFSHNRDFKEYIDSQLASKHRPKH